MCNRFKDCVLTKSNFLSHVTEWVVSKWDHKFHDDGPHPFIYPNRSDRLDPSHGIGPDIVTNKVILTVGLNSCKTIN